MRTSKITTICGFVAMAAGCVVAANFSPLVNKIALCIGAIAGGAIGIFARDNGVSDEQAGAKPVAETTVTVTKT